MDAVRRLPFFASTPDGAVAGSADFFARGRFLLPEAGEEKPPQSLGLEAFTGKKLGSYSSLAAGPGNDGADGRRYLARSSSHISSSSRSSSSGVLWSRSVSTWGGMLISSACSLRSSEWPVSGYSVASSSSKSASRSSLLSVCPVFCCIAHARCGRSSLCPIFNFGSSAESAMGSSHRRFSKGLTTGPVVSGSARCRVGVSLLVHRLYYLIVLGASLIQ
ncbi:hypothetical protein Q059_03662 [Pseudomonas aeruginosa BL05]|nr:hypothetical protein Q059_03662 [Pseudomonas aeruginosa BL05]